MRKLRKVGIDAIGRRVYGRPASDGELRLVERVIVYIAIPLALIAMLPGLIGLGFSYVETTNRVEAVSEESKARSRSIQRSRAETTLEACQEQNTSNLDTINVLDARIAELPPEQRAAAARSRAFTVLLIDALAPRRPCAELVRERYGFVPK